MTETELAGLLEFLRLAERLKTVKRSGFTSTGEPESVADHTWRLSLLAMVVAPHMPDIDVGRCSRSVSCTTLARQLAVMSRRPNRHAVRRRDWRPERESRNAPTCLTLVQPLPSSLQSDITALWDEYEAAQTAEARLAKGLDKLETILQHVQGDNPADFDYRFNLNYGRVYTTEPPLVAALRRLLDEATEDRARQSESGSP